MLIRRRCQLKQEFTTGEFTRSRDDRLRRRERRQNDKYFVSIKQWILPASDVVFMSGGAERAARRIAIAEREKFVRWAITAIHATEDRDFNRDDLGHYRWTELDAAWKAWQARAAIIREETGTQERDAMLLEFINEHHSEQRDPNCHICKTAMKIEAALPAAPDEGGTR